MAKRSAPEVNAGSMADIAFLLLIFFMVTTTIEKDSGLNRKLPPIEENEEDVVIKQKNIFTVTPALATFKSPAQTSIFFSININDNYGHY